MSQIADQFFNLAVMRQTLPFLLQGLLVTLLLTAVLVPLGMACGLALALASTTRATLPRIAARIWVNVFRAMPPLVLIILIYSALPFLGIRFPAIVCVVIALALNNAAYFCEIFRAGIASVPLGQMEAARSTGLGAAAALRDVVLPQAVRNVLPDLASNTIEVMKATSLAAVISAGELLYVASNARSITYNASPLVLAALLYLLILVPAVRLASRLGNRTVART